MLDTDKIITLATDTYQYESGWRVRNGDREKLLVMGRLVRDGEAKHSAATLAINPDRKEPLPPPDLR